MKLVKSDLSNSVPDLEVEREFNAPLEVVWKAWTNAQQFKKWWGPKDFSCPYAKMDFRTGGTYHNCMRSPEGDNYWGTGVYKEIIPMRKIVFTDSFADDLGNVVPATNYGMGKEFPLTYLVTLLFEEKDGNTVMTLYHEGMPDEESKKMAAEGWNGAFDKLAAML